MTGSKDIKESVGVINRQNLNIQLRIMYINSILYSEKIKRTLLSPCIIWKYLIMN